MVSIVYKEANGTGSAPAIIIGVFAFLAMIVLGFGLRWLYNRSVVAEVDQQKKTMSKIAEAAKEVDLYASNMKLKVPVDESKSHIELATENNLVTEVVQDQ